MNKSAYGPSGPSLFGLGFEHGAEADDDPSDLDFRSRVQAYQLGFIVGRSFSEAVKQTNPHAAAAIAVRLGARFGVDLEDLLTTLGLSEAHQQDIRQAYAQSTSR